MEDALKHAHFDPGRVSRLTLAALLDQLGGVSYHALQTSAVWPLVDSGSE